jgi:hypothetical protein
MADAKRREVPAGLVRARDRFVAWRRTRKPKSRIPEPLWTLAVKLVAAHGLHRTAATLKLDYYSLKKRVEATEGPREKNDAPFLELPAAVAAVPECVIELEEGAARWRVQLKGYSAADIAVVGRSVRDSQR